MARRRDPRLSDQAAEEKTSTQQEQEQSGAEGEAFEEERSEGDSADLESEAAGQALSPDISSEEEEALEQWLRRIPDDPGGLLRRKFIYQYRQRDRKPEGGKQW